MNRGDQITAVVGGRLVLALVLGNLPGGSTAFYYAHSFNANAPVYAASYDDEHITWCRGHISREEAMPLIAAAGLAGK